MLHFQIDPHSGVPAYRQVMDQVKYYIASGVLQTGTKLPSIRRMAKSISVNPTTIVKAYNELQHEGVIEMRQGRGAFVAPGGASMTETDRRRVLEEPIRRLVVEASQLGVSDQDLLQMVREATEDLAIRGRIGGTS